MLLSRTRRRFVHGLKEFVYDKVGLQSVAELREKHRLEDSMGFRGQFDEHRRFQMALLKEQGLAPHHRLLEIGCGPLTAGIPIIAYLEPNAYTGIDVRSSVLDMAWKEIGKAGLSIKNPRLICSSSFGSSELGDQKFDFILSFSVLYHLDDELLASYFAAVQKRLEAASGVCLANVNTLHDGGTWLEFPFLRRTLEAYRRTAAAHGLEMKSLGEIGGLGFGLCGPERQNELLSFRVR